MNHLELLLTQHYHLHYNPFKLDLQFFFLTAHYLCHHTATTSATILTRKLHHTDGHHPNSIAANYDISRALLLPLVLPTPVIIIRTS